MIEASITIPASIDASTAASVREIIEQQLPRLRVTSLESHDQGVIEILAFGPFTIPSIGLLSRILSEIQQQTQMDHRIQFESDRGTIVYPL